MKTTSLADAPNYIDGIPLPAADDPRWKLRRGEDGKDSVVWEDLHGIVGISGDRHLTVNVGCSVHTRVKLNVSKRLDDFLESIHEAIAVNKVEKEKEAVKDALSKLYTLQSESGKPVNK